MGYGQKVKKWFFDEDGDEVEEYEEVEIDTEPKTSLFEQAKFLSVSHEVILLILLPAYYSTKNTIIKAYLTSLF